ncbi:MAG: hypothetical protein HQM16_06580 [Deltaproteobacteria bacterium]|nr:hypothetical protein [Deltaproteobacteria bacterium]
MKTLKLLLTLVLISGITGCATNFASALEDARFALDNENWDEAIEKASDALAADPTSIEAGRLLSNAYFGRSGLDYLDIAEGIIDLETASADSDLERIAAVLPDTVTMADLRLAITTLEGFAAISSATSYAAVEDEELADAIFDLGMMQTIEHFAIGVYSSNYFGTFDPSLITADNATSVQSDLVGFDDRLIQSGLDADESYLNEIRKGYCVLANISAAAGFTQGEYQAWVACELSSDPSTVVTITYSAAIANCAALNPEGASSSCYGADTSE